MLFRESEWSTLVNYLSYTLVPMTFACLFNGLFQFCCKVRYANDDKILELVCFIGFGNNTLLTKCIFIVTLHFIAFCLCQCGKKKDSLRNKGPVVETIKIYEFKKYLLLNHK